MTLSILATGGTIDKVHDPITESLIFGGKSLIPDILKQAKINRVHVTTLMLKDSLEMGAPDRDEILAAIRADEAKGIIITHGTSTMVETAWFLKAHHTEFFADKVIVLTGAMRPFSLQQSDAEFNLGTAFGCAQTHQAGVYIAMNGRVFDADAVVKETDIGVFQGE